MISVPLGELIKEWIADNPFTFIVLCFALLQTFRVWYYKTKVQDSGSRSRGRGGRRDYDDRERYDRGDRY